MEKLSDQSSKTVSSVPLKNLAAILGAPASALASLDKKMAAATGRSGILDKIWEANEAAMHNALSKINSDGGSADHIRGVLKQVIVGHEKQLLALLDAVPGKNEFEKMAELSRRMTSIKKGVFLKKGHIQEIFEVSPPYNLMKYLGYGNIKDLIAKENLIESFSALRFIESNEWMHETFAKAYSQYTQADFEERAIEVRVLPPRWHEIAKKFVEKKHHNVSHLKEFGVIFLNPISEDIPGKILRDFALLLHYFHEIDFYSKLFRKYFPYSNFGERFKSLLRGDVKEIQSTALGEWLIVQRYLFKDNSYDPRLKLPRVNPESMHWARGERDLGECVKDNKSCCDIAMWEGLDWVGGLFKNGRGGQLVSFDLEDNAMSLASFMEGKHEFLTYHQREAIWTKIFSEYVGGESEMEKILIDRFDKGVVKF